MLVGALGTVRSKSPRSLPRTRSTQLTTKWRSAVALLELLTCSPLAPRWLRGSSGELVIYLPCTGMKRGRGGGGQGGPPFFFGNTIVPGSPAGRFARI